MKRQSIFFAFGFFFLNVTLTTTVMVNAAVLGAGYSLGSGSAGAVRENFDGIDAYSTTAPGMGGDTYWAINVSNTERATNLITANTFPSNGGYNAGPWPDSGLSPATDRALGIYAGSTTDNPRYLTVMLTNNTGAALTQFYLYFDVEAWIIRNSGTLRYGGLQAAVSTDNSTYQDLGNSFEAILQFPDLGDSVNNYWVNGNDAANSVRNVGGLVTGVNVPAGAVFYLRFFAWGPTLTAPSGYANRQVGVALDNLYVGVQDQVAPQQVLIPKSLLTFSPGSFSFPMPTATGKTYALEYSPQISTNNWTTVQSAAGSGNPVTLTHTNATSSRGFYRVRVD